MGNFNLKSGIFRCQNCFSIYRIKIIISQPESFVNLHCKCTTSQTTIKAFMTELTKGPKMKPICCQCQKMDEKAYSYCNDCNHIYCNKCIKKSHNTHVYISITKSDFYCVFHPKDNFSHFCKDCEMNLCRKCLENKIHNNHDVVAFEKILMKKNEREFLKEKYNLVQEKLSFNNELVNSLAKKMKKEDAEKILNLEKVNTEQNKLILELIKFFTYLYDTSKLKNYNIIVNLIDNINLNVDKLELWDKNIKIEELFIKLENYFKKDYIIISNDGQEKSEENYKNSKNINKQTKNTISNEKEKEKNNNSSNNNKNEKKSENQKIDKKSNNTTKKICNDKKLNEEKSKIINDTKENKLIKTNTLNNKKIINNEIVSNNYTLNKNDIIFNNKKGKKINYTNNKNNLSQPPKIAEKNIKKSEKERTIVTKEAKKIKENIIIEKPKELKKDKPKEMKKEKEIIELKEEIDKKENNKIIEKNNEINNIQIKENKYANLLSINRFRNNPNSTINLMMVNGLYNKKIFDINLG